MSEARPGPLTLAAFLLVAIVGGSNVVAVRLSNRELDPMWGAGIRFAVAALLLFAVTRLARVELPRGRAFAGAAVFGLFSFFGFFTLAYYALQPGGVSAALAGVIMGMIPVLTLILAVAQRIEHFSARALVGALIAVAGVVVMVGAPSNSGVPLLSLGAMLAAAACAAQATIVVKRFPPANPIAMNAVAMALAAPLILGLSAITGEDWTLPQQTTTWLTLAYMIPVGSVLLFILVVYVLHHWSASAASYQFVLFPIVTALVGAWVAGEALNAAIAVGSALVIAGVYVGALSGPRATHAVVAATVRPAE
jgi:drug/metabolite transporter (DMT)-like permease